MRNDVIEGHMGDISFDDLVNKLETAHFLAWCKFHECKLTSKEHKILDDVMDYTSYALNRILNLELDSDPQEEDEYV